MNIENLAINVFNVGNKFYFFGFSIEPVYQGNKSFPSGKKEPKRVFLGPKISLVKVRNRLKIGFMACK